MSRQSRLVASMTGAEYLLWGIFGGSAVEGLEFSRAIRATGSWPWRLRGEPGALPYAVSVVVRLLVGGGLALALGLDHQIIGVFGALTCGVAAPLILEQLAQRIPESVEQHGHADASHPAPDKATLPIPDPAVPQAAVDCELGESDAP